MALLDREHQPRPLSVKLTEQSPPCDKCNHYWPTVSGLACLWGVGDAGVRIKEPDFIEDTTGGHCDAFRYR